MRKKLILVAAFFLFVLSFYFFRVYDVSVNDIVALPLTLISSLSNPGSLVSASKIISLVMFLVLQLSAFVLVGVYALKDLSRYRMQLPLLCGSAACIVGLLFIKADIIYATYSMGMILSCYLSAKYFPKFYDEYKVWRYFRTGSAIVKLALIVISITVSLGVFIEASSNADIKDNVYNATLDALRSGVDFEVNASDIPGYSNLTSEEKERLDRRIEEQNQQAKIQVDNLLKTQLDSPMIRAYINNIGIIAAVTIFFSLLFLRGIISPIGGAVAFVALNILQRKKKHHDHQEHR